MWHVIPSKRRLGKSGRPSWMSAGFQQTQSICITFVQCRTNVEDVGPILYKCYTNVLCLLCCYLACQQSRLSVWFDQSSLVLPVVQRELGERRREDEKLLALLPWTLDADWHHGCFRPHPHLGGWVPKRRGRDLSPIQHAKANNNLLFEWVVTAVCQCRAGRGSWPNLAYMCTQVA